MLTSLASLYLFTQFKGHNYGHQLENAISNPSASIIVEVGLELFNNLGFAPASVGLVQSGPDATTLRHVLAAIYGNDILVVLRGTCLSVGKSVHSAAFQLLFGGFPQQFNIVHQTTCLKVKRFSGLYLWMAILWLNS